eukprot:TRINITY_DN4054_c0_g1_i1.p1 TRINITY_DN4054_c0_g1~~TRINITY_DN4054_c0_g1_i1.p1  ORF type:complete len:600 (-),score=233.19 TRINITY_DN4054_c0_g1_i1:288-2057(-)
MLCAIRTHALRPRRLTALARRLAGHGIQMEDWAKGNDPSLFIKKIDRHGADIEGSVKPEDLLVDHYRGRSMLDTMAEASAASAVRLTGDDAWGKAVTAIWKKVGAFRCKEAFFAFRDLPFSEEEQCRIHFELKKKAVQRLAAVTTAGKPSLEVLVTGGTGFIGMDLLKSLAPDPTVKRVYCVVWHQEMGTSTPQQFKDHLMGLLGITTPEEAAKYEILPGDVTQESMGLSESDLSRVSTRITHFIHLAASVSFDDPYEKMFKANVTATQMALKFALRLQEQPNAAFVNFIATETCYIHGRNLALCREDELIFPRDYYNNHYELTKALGDLYCRHFTLEKKLQVISLCPAITVGDYRTGNNHGDTKVINAAANAFGRIGDEVKRQHWLVQAAAMYMLTFPGLPEARLNLINVDRVTAGLHAALTRPLATCERVHLGGDGIRLSQFTRVFHEEIGLRVRMVNPVIHRIFRRPIMRLVARWAGLDKAYKKLEGLFDIFSSYAEWGQPVHELGNDVRLLGLPATRPDIVYLVQMLCRHNRTVQGYGKIRDKAVIAEREKKWAAFIDDLERRAEVHPAAISAGKFQEAAKDLAL